MVANRYTQPQVAQYNPMSLQELMMVPSMKRTQHDNLLQGAAETRAGLAQLDRLGVHDEEYQKVQSGLEKKLEDQVNEVTANGISQNAKSNFYDLHANYQKEVSPTGRLGRMQAAKEAMETERQTFIANDTAMGYSPDQAARNWEEHAAQYTGYNDRGEVTNIDPLYSPNYYDPTEMTKGFLKEMGIEGEDISNVTSNIVYDEVNGRYVSTESDRNATTDNSNNISAVVDYMNGQIMNPNSRLRQSMDHQGMSPEDALNEIKGMGAIYKKKNTIEQNGTQISGFGSGASTRKSDMEGVGIVQSKVTFDSEEYSGKDYYTLRQTRDELQSALDNQDPNIDPREASRQLAEIDFYTEELHNKMSKDDNYVSSEEFIADYTSRDNVSYVGGESSIPTGRHIPEELKGMILNHDANERVEIERVEVAGNNTWDNDEENRKDKTAYEITIGGETIVTEDKELRKAASDFQMQVLGHQKKNKELAEKYKEDVALEVNTYSLVPETPKQRSAYKAFSENISNLFQTSPENINSFTYIEEIDYNGKRKKITEQEDKDGIAKILSNMEPGDLTPVANTPKGANQKPQYILRIQTNEDNKYDLEGIWGDDDGDIGGGQPLTITVSFDENQGGGAMNVNGYLQDFWRSTGPRGAQIADEMEYNRVISNHNGKFWKDVITEDTDFANVHPVILGDVYNKLFDGGYLDESIESIREEDPVKANNLVKGAIDNFIADNGEQRIYIE